VKILIIYKLMDVMNANLNVVVIVLLVFMEFVIIANIHLH